MSAANLSHDLVLDILSRDQKDIIANRKEEDRVLRPSFAEHKTRSLQHL